MNTTKLLALVSLALGLFAVGRALFAGETPLNRHFHLYTQSLDRLLKLTFTEGSGRRIAVAQLAAGAAIAGLVAFTSLPATCLGGIALVGVAPKLHLTRLRQKHVKRLESQVDTLIVGLANALKTVPSPAAALGQLVTVLPNPMRLEVSRMLKEMRVGSTLEQALVAMSTRLESRDIDSALSAVLIGLQVGGNLPQVLENTAATIREMNRLEGVVRTKTSEARAQLWVLALFPFGIALAFRAIDPQYFAPLEASFLGTLVTVFAALLWIASLLSARKILKVDI